MKKNIKSLIDDGFNHDLVEGATFDGIFEIPHIPGPNKIFIPKGMVPYTQSKYCKEKEYLVVFYEHDIKFRDILISTKNHIPELQNFAGVVSPDCSLYRDMPLSLQIANVYLNRAVGYSFWKEGLYTIPNIRWGDERSYTTLYFPEPFAFLGADKHSIVSIGTYGCIKGKENTEHFAKGLAAMIDYLEPEIVLVYGPMPDKIFKPLLDKTTFISYPDWISTKKRTES